MRGRQKPKAKKQNGIWLFFLVIFLAELLFYTWGRVQCIRVGYEISEEAKKIKQMEMVQNNLKLELAHLKSPERIAKIAMRDLGLVMPNTKQTMIIP